MEWITWKHLLQFKNEYNQGNISLAANCGWNLQQLGVENVFLHGELEEKIYMELPSEYGEQTIAIL